MSHSGNHRRCTGTSTTTHTSGDKHHLGATRLKELLNLGQSLHSEFLATLWIVTSTQARTHHDFVLIRDVEVIQRTLIGITSQEVYILDTDVPHIVEGITTCTTNSNNCYYRRACFRHRQLIHQIFHYIE